MRLFIPFIFILLFAQKSSAQCTVTANNGSYRVNITIYPIAISNVVQTGGDCTFTTEMYYDLQITGNNPPSSMYTLQGRVHCAGQNRTFDLPNQGGTGVVTSANGQAPWINGNCTAYNETFCDQTVIIIQGPNITYQEVICNSSSPLPVELVTFNGKQSNNSVELNFSTASEKNNDFFTIEKTTDGKEWSIIETINGNGTTDQLSQYSTIDRTPSAGKNYYRLSQTDFDGKKEIYTIIAVSYNSLSTTNYSMYPNPTNNNSVNVIFESQSQMDVNCNVYNLLGKKVGSYILTSSNKLEKIQLPESNSTYIVELVQDNEVIARERIISN